MNVLYIEDYPLDAELVRDTMLRNAPDIRLDIVTSVAEAVTRLHRFELAYAGKTTTDRIAGTDYSAAASGVPHYDLVLSDLSLPDGSGLDVLAHVRRRSLTLAVVFLTGSGQQESVYQALHAGADDYLTKAGDYLTALPATLRSAYQHFQDEYTRTTTTLHVLYAEPNHADADLTLRELAKSAPHIVIEVVRSAGEVLAQLGDRGKTNGGHAIDVLLLDFRMPGMTAIDLVKELHQIQGMDIPIVLVTGYGSEELARTAMKLGVNEYLVKSPGYMERLPFAIENAYYRAANLRERLALIKSERDFHSLADHLPDVIARFDRNNRHLYVNPVIEHITGRPAKEFIGRSNTELGMPPDKVALWDVSIQQAFATGEEQKIDFSFDGLRGMMYFDALFVPEKDSSGKANTVLVIARNITERWHTERALRAREQQLTVLTEQFPGIVSHLDQDLRFLYVNAEFERVSGFSSEKVLGRTLQEMDPDNWPTLEPLYRKGLAGEKVEFETEAPSHDGSRKYLLIRIAPARRSDGQVDGVFASIIDLTQRRLAELALREREQHLSVMTDQFPGLISRVDRDLRYLFVNQKYVKWFGRPKEQILGQTIPGVTSHERFAHIRHHYERALQGENVTFEAYRPAMDGRNESYGVATLIPDRAPDGSIQGLIVTVLDITDRWRAEKALRAREQQLSLVTEAFPGGIAHVDHDLRYLYANAEYVKSTHFDMQQIVGRTMLEFMGPERFAMREPQLRRALAGERVVMEIIRARKEGLDRNREEYGILTYQPEFDADRKVCGLFITVIDITELKKTESALRHTEARMAGIVKSAMDAIVAVDQEQKIILFNPAAERIFQRTENEMRGQAITLLLSARGRKSHNKLLHNLRKKGNATQHTVTEHVWGLRADGSEFPVEASISRMEIDEGQIFTLILRDISERYEAERVLRDREMQLRVVTNHFPGQIARLDRDLRYVFVNAQYEHIFNMPLEKIVGMKAVDLLGTEQFGRVEHHYHRALRGEQVTFEDGMRFGSPEKKYWVVNLIPDIEDGAVKGLFVTVLDITERKLHEWHIARLTQIQMAHGKINAAMLRIQDRKELLREVCQAIAEGAELGMVSVALIDELRNQLVTEAWAGFEGVEIDHYTISLDSPNVQRGALFTSLRTKTAVTIEDIDRDPEVGYLRREAVKQGYRSVIALPLFMRDQVIGAINAFSKDRAITPAEVQLMTDLVQDVSIAIEYLDKADRIKYLAFHDTLTDLPNRSQFQERLLAPVTPGQGQIQSPGLMKVVALFDIARFRLINDSFGRNFADELLKLIASRLMGTGLPKGDLARLEGNTFGVILSGFEQQEQALAALEHILMTIFGTPFRLAGHELHLKAKCGALLFPSYAKNAEMLLQQAGLALLNVKPTVENVLFYRPDMEERSAEALQLEGRLRRALQEEQFVLYYQPKLDLTNETITSVEALIRWNDPETGLVPPNLFIPILEKTGMIFDVGRWVLRQAAMDFKRWAHQGLKAPRIAVNVSSLQLGHRDFVPDLQAVASDHSDGLGHGIDLEITESVIMDDLDQNIGRLRAARELGMDIAVDDFGTGYSSLSYLSKLPVNALKIDRSFVMEMTGSEQGRLLVASIITLAHTLKLKVVAEGVETVEQMKILVEAGCDLAQGYFISKPVPCADLEKLMRQHDPVNPH